MTISDGLDISQIYIDLMKSRTSLQIEKPVQYNLFCESCGKIQNHELYASGDWEYYTCPSGHQQSYRVR